MAEGLDERWRATGAAPLRVSLDATSRLVGQLSRGAPFDLIVTADEEWMEEARTTGRVGPTRAVASNRLVLVAGARSPVARGEAVLETEIAALLRSGTAPLALAGEEVPAGRYAREALAWLGVDPSALARPVATGGSVRTALEWVARGEAEYGIVYASDAAADSAVRTVYRFPSEAHTPIRYWAASVEGRGDALLDWLGGAEAAGVLRAGGFGAPGEPPIARAEGAAGAPATADRAPVEVGGPSPGSVPRAPRSRGPSLPSALLLSIGVALAAVLLGTVPAVAVGRMLSQRAFPGRTAVSALLLAPLVVPPVVTGFLLLALLGADTPIGGALAALGLPVPFTPLAAVLAAAAVGLPLYAVVVRSAFESVDSRYEELSWTLGVPPRSTFRRIALPLALPGIAAGAVLAFARALGEFGATIVLAGNVEGETRTLALAVYTLLETPGAGGRIWFFVAASVVLSLGALLLYERLLTRQRARMEDGRVG